MQVLSLTSLAAVLVTVAIVALLRGRYDGRVRSVLPDPDAIRGGGWLANRQPTSSVRFPALADLGITLPAERVAVVQFSGGFCAACPQARTLVERVLRDHPDIAHVEVDVAEHLEAVRSLDIRRTPTLLILDRYGRPVHRVSGMPREGELRQAMSELAIRR